MSRARKSVFALPLLAGAVLLLNPVDSSQAPSATPAPTGYRVRVVASGLPNPAGVAFANGSVYVSTRAAEPGGSGSLVRIDPATRRLTLLLQRPDAPASFSLGPRGDALWTRESDGALVRLAGPGSVPAVVRAGLRLPGAVAVDGAQSVYWVEDRRSSAAPDANGILTMNGGRARLLLATGARPTSLAAGPDGRLYYTNAAEGLLLRVGSDGKAEVLLRGLLSPTSVAISPDGRTVYVSEVPSPGVAGAADGGNTVSAFELATSRRTLVAAGDPGPIGLAAGDGGRVYWASRSGLVLEASPVYSDVVTALHDGESRGSSAKFTATLDGAHETPPVTTSATGTGKFQLKEARPGDSGTGSSSERGRHGEGDDDKGNGGGPWLRYAVKAKGIVGFTASHIHLGAPGQPGPIVAPLKLQESEEDDRAKRIDESHDDGEIELEGKIRPADLTGPLAGNWDGFVAALRAGGLYVNIHTTAHPSGEIRGQIGSGPTPPTDTPPNGTITSPPGDVTIAAGGSVDFAGQASDADGDTVTVLWDFGDGGTSTALVPGAHVYTNPGTYNVTFTATDQNGLVDPTPDTRTITVTPATANQPPDATITSPATDVTITAGQSVSFAGTATDPDGDMVTVLWSFGDGSTSTDLTPGAHTFASAGTYTVTLTATDSKGLADPTPATRTITVTPATTNEPPNGTITSPPTDVTITAGQSVSFAGTATDPNGDAVTVLWDFGDGSTSTALVPGDHAYPNAGTFTVTFTATDATGLADPTPDTRTVTVQPPTVNQPPDGTITSPASNVTINAGQAVSFSGTASDPDGDAVTVLWDFGDGSTSTALAPGDHVYANAGTYTVTFTATDAQGLADPTPDTRTITVNAPPPTATLTMVQSQIFTPKCTGCHGGSSPTAGMNLEAGQAWSNLVNVPATTQGGFRVVPGDPSNSVLFTFLTAGHRSGSVTAADRQLISDWISAGALDN